ncbi:hypothetical protein SLA_3065 [Streptomyces laurentii]|uniref:Uncharacterized protein n=1 Tax=Streptomyces laurentii TaxID=39478 RepID=A0A160NYJ1_STRLU|nr:hypothetical protein SLA_3065 [Streptomyces laurentii]
MRDERHGRRHDERHGLRLSDDELKPFVQYPHRYADHDPDLFALLEVGDPERPAYVSLRRDPEPGLDISAYRRPFTDRPG